MFLDRIGRIIRSSSLDSTLTPLVVGTICTHLVDPSVRTFVLNALKLIPSTLIELLQHTLLPDEGFYAADVGAYVGFWTCLSSRLVGTSGRVYGFEPDTRNFNVMKRVVRLWGLTNVRLSNIALSDADGFSTLYVSPTHPTTHSLMLKDSNAIPRRVLVRRLDTLVEEGFITKLDLIKIDVEGAELRVLQGSRKAIHLFKPLFIVDVNHYNGELEDVVKFFTQYDYAIEPIDQLSRPRSVVAYPVAMREEVARLKVKTRRLSRLIYGVRPSY